MVGAGDVIADCLGGVAAEKDGTGIAYRDGKRLGIIDRQLKVLGRDAID